MCNISFYTVASVELMLKMEGLFVDALGQFKCYKVKINVHIHY